MGIICTLEWEVMHTVRKGNGQLEETPLPDRLLLARNPTIPLLQIETASRKSRRPREEAEGVVFPPLLSEFQSSTR
jgi:hypothetical protein